MSVTKNVYGITNGKEVNAFIIENNGESNISNNKLERWQIQNELFS